MLVFFWLGSWKNAVGDSVEAICFVETEGTPGADFFVDGVNLIFGDRHPFFLSCPKIVHLFIWTYLKHPAKKGVVGYSKILSQDVPVMRRFLRLQFIPKGDQRWFSPLQGQRFAEWSGKTLQWINVNNLSVEICWWIFVRSSMSCTSS